MLVAKGAPTWHQAITCCDCCCRLMPLVSQVYARGTQALQTSGPHACKLTRKALSENLDWTSPCSNERHVASMLRGAQMCEQQYAGSKPLSMDANQVKLGM